jgi:hypothetical protein
LPLGSVPHAPYLASTVLVAHPRRARASIVKVWFSVRATL